MPLVVDASVAVKWLIEEEGSDRAERLRTEVLHAPSLIRIEVTNVLRTLVASRRLEDADGRAAQDILLDAPLELHEPSDALMHGAFDIALCLNHPIYDCLYLALAIDLGIRLVTADRKFHRATQKVTAFDGVVGEL